MEEIYKTMTQEHINQRLKEIDQAIHYDLNKLNRDLTIQDLKIRQDISILKIFITINITFSCLTLLRLFGYI